MAAVGGPAEDAGLLDLGLIVLWVVALGLLTFAYYLLKPLEWVVNAIGSIPVPFIGNPFANLAQEITNTVTEPLDDARQGAEAQLTKGIYGLVSSLALIVGLTGLALIGLRDLFVWLWDAKINPLVESAATALVSLVNTVSADVAHLRAAVYTDFEASYDYIDATVSGAVVAAESYAKAQAEAAIDTATSYADQAVAGLRAIEDKAIENAVDLANAAASTAAADLQKARDYTDSTVAAASGALTSLIDAAKNAAEQAAADALSAAVTKLDTAVSDARAAAASGIATAEKDAGDLVSQAVDALTGQITNLKASTNAALAAVAGAASSALSSASGAIGTEISAAVSGAEALASAGDQAVTAALDQVRSIAITAETDVQTLAGAAGIAGSAALISSIPALATLVYAIANEAGLGNSQCRQKVGKVCSTDPAAWAQLLAGAAFLALAFDFKEFVDVAEQLAGAVGDGVAVLEQPFLAALPPLALAA